MTDFKPILYLKQGCPNCFKVRLFLLEAGLLGQFDQHEFTPGDSRETSVRAELAPHFAKVTFPTVQYARGDYMNESDDIVAHYARINGIDRSALPLFTAFADKFLPTMRQLKRDKAQLADRLAAFEPQSAG